MLPGLSFRSDFVFSISSLMMSGFPLTSFHLAEVNLVSRAILQNQKPIFRIPLIAKRCAGVKVELKLHHLLFRGCTFLYVQLSTKIAKCFLKKVFFSPHFAINLIYLYNLKT